MAGAILERELTASKAGGVSFSVATNEDDAEIRRLLRENPMPGRISLSLEREPDFFADANSSTETKNTIVARDGRRVVCVGSCCVRQRFVNGKPRTVGYLGGLRLDARVAGRFDILRRGYDYFRQLQRDAPADFYFTSIAADNQRARTFLERGLPGMPRYEFVCEFVTLVIPTLPCRQCHPSSHNIAHPDRNGSLGFLNECNSAYQFAPHWSLEDLPPSEFRVFRTGQQIEACGALWDQRQFKQIVVRGYSKLLATARPIFNIFSRLTHQPRLPNIGEALSIAFASCLASKIDAPLVRLIQRLSNSARQRGIELLTLGFAGNDPRLANIRRNFRCREYRSRIYVVHWPGIGGTARELDNRVLAPEVALL
jgi:hypothetical protein